MMKVMVWSFVYAILPYDFISSQQRINDNLLKIPAKQLYRKLTPKLELLHVTLQASKNLVAHS
jgi:hypothetical protein